MPESEREREEAVEEAAEVVALVLVLCCVELRAERTSLREPPGRELLKAREEEEEEGPRVLLLPGGRPGPRIWGTHLMPREVHIWQGLRRLQRFWGSEGGSEGGVSAVVIQKGGCLLHVMNEGGRGGRR